MLDTRRRAILEVRLFVKPRTSTLFVQGTNLNRISVREEISGGENSFVFSSGGIRESDQCSRRRDETTSNFVSVSDRSTTKSSRRILRQSTSARTTEIRKLFVRFIGEIEVRGQRTFSFELKKCFVEDLRLKIKLKRSRS